MKKIVRLTESDLTRLVKRVIKESEDKIENTGELDIQYIEKLQRHDDYLKSLFLTQTQKVLDVVWDNVWWRVRDKINNNSFIEKLIYDVSMGKYTNPNSWEVSFGSRYPKDNVPNLTDEEVNSINTAINDEIKRQLTRQKNMEDSSNRTKENISKGREFKSKETDSGITLKFGDFGGGYQYVIYFPENKQDTQILHLGDAINLGETIFNFIEDEEIKKGLTSEQLYRLAEYYSKGNNMRVVKHLVPHIAQLVRDFIRDEEEKGGLPSKSIYYLGSSYLEMLISDKDEKEALRQIKDITQSVRDINK